MATAQREGGLYFVNGKAVDAEGQPIKDAPKPTPDTDPSKQPGAPGSPAADPIARLADLLAGKVPATQPSTKGSAKATTEPDEEPELPTLANLSDHLAGLSTVAEVKALQKSDERVGAVKMYEDRIAEIEAE